MSGLENVLNAEEQKKTDALLLKFEEKIKTKTAEYIAGSVAPEIESLKKSALPLDEIQKKIDAIQRKIDEAHVENQKREHQIYKEIFEDVRHWRGKRSEMAPRAGRTFVAYLQSINNAVDGVMSAKNLVEVEKLHGFQYPELAETFKAMGNDKRVTKAIMSLSSPQGGGFAVPSVLSNEVIEALYARTFFDKVGVAKINMPQGNFSMPKIGEKATATYTGETQKLAKTGQKLEQVRWIAHELGGLIPVSRQLFIANAVGLEGLIIADMARVMNLKKEHTALYGTGESGVPKGLDKILPNTTAYRLGGSSTPLTSSIPARMAAAIESKDVVTDLAWVTHPQIYWYLWDYKSTTGDFIFRDELEKGTLGRYPITTTTQVSFTDTGTYETSYGDIWLGNWRELIMAQFTDMEIMVSDQTSFTGDDGNMISAFENNLVVIRFVEHHDFNTRHNESFLKGTYKLAPT